MPRMSTPCVLQASRWTPGTCRWWPTTCALRAYTNPSIASPSGPTRPRYSRWPSRPATSSSKTPLWWVSGASGIIRKVDSWRRDVRKLGMVEGKCGQIGTFPVWALQLYIVSNWDQPSSVSTCQKWSFRDWPCDVIWVINTEFSTLAKGDVLDGSAKV